LNAYAKGDFSRFLNCLEDLQHNILIAIALNPISFADLNLLLFVSKPTLNLGVESLIKTKIIKLDSLGLYQITNNKLVAYCKMQRLKTQGFVTQQKITSALKSEVIKTLTKETDRISHYQRLDCLSAQPIIELVADLTAKSYLNLLHLKLDR